jgi:glyoxylase-like metal-dependent hydrolase (beta-lactamase superfamily II)
MLMRLPAEGVTAQEKTGQNVITFEVGFSRISTLSEGQQSGKSNVLKGATPEMLRTFLPEGNYPSATNAFLVRTEDKNILVDAGLGRLLTDNLQSLGITPEQIDVILLTHMHGDHIGGLLHGEQTVFPDAELYLAQAEHDYWMSDQAMQQVEPDRRNGFLQARRVIAAYKDRLHLFTPHEPGADETELIPGIQGIAAYGHTPGHTAYLIESDNESLLIWGDLTHAMAIQMPCPDVAVIYDINPDQAVESRKKILEYAVENNLPIAGMHIAFPAVGEVIRAENRAGSYTFMPFCLCLGI